jgi:hypothetical protein
VAECAVVAGLLRRRAELAAEAAALKARLAVLQP